MTSLLGMNDNDGFGSKDGWWDDDDDLLDVILDNNDDDDSNVVDNVKLGEKIIHDENATNKSNYCTTSRVS